MTKNQLFVDDCIYIAMMYNMSYWDAYMLPLHVRKYMISVDQQIKDKQRQATQKSYAGMQELAQKAPSSQALPKMDFLSQPQRNRQNS